MENNIYVLGDENSVIYYNLNKQFTNIKKVIITKDVIFVAWGNNRLKGLVEDLKASNPKTYKEVLSVKSKVFEEELSTELYKQIQDILNKVSNGYMDVKLKDYNFMNSVSNTKFNIVLRCDSFSITHYYVEKGTMLSNIKNLVSDYLNFEGNFYRLPRLDNFQIEITPSEEIYKHILLKKDGNSIILSSIYGFPKNAPIDYSIGHEFYVSKGKEFQFFKNNQTHAILREHNKLVEKEINPQEKILSHEDLVLVNEKTKNIDDAIIECYITSKGQFRIVHLSVIENPISEYSENGFILSKSRNSYDRIAVLNFRDNFDEDYVNPKYLLLKTDANIKEFISELNIIEKIDGIILTKNFYNLYLDVLGKTQNLDILYLNKTLSKSLDEKINWEHFDIENSVHNSKESNPFVEMISQGIKGEDALLERLKNIDLSTPKERPQEVNREHISGVVNNIIGSAESSFNRGNNNSNNSSMYGDTGSGKKSAMDMLMNSAMNHKKEKETPKEQEYREPLKQEPSQNIEQEKEEISYNIDNKFDEMFSQSHSQSHSNSHHNQAKNLKDFTSMGNESVNTSNNSEEEDNIALTLNKIKEQSMLQDNPTKSIQSNIDISKYENILATEIIGSPESNVDAYLVDMNSIGHVSGTGKTYFLTLNKDEMKNPNLHYVLPIGLNSPEVRNCALLVSNVGDYFLIDEDQKSVDYFVNICEVNNLVKKKLIKEICQKVGPIYLICYKKDLELVSENITKIKGLQVKDVTSNDELKEVKEKVLSYEKRALLRE